MPPDAIPVPTADDLALDICEEYATVQFAELHGDRLGNSAAYLRLLAAAEAELADHERSFELRHRADMRGIAAWRAAHPGNDLVQPDHGDLVCWLIEDRDRLLAAAKAARLELMHGGFWPLVDLLDAALAGR